MSTLERALEIAAQAHRGQVDKQGGPYILHPLRVMMQVDDLEAQIVAALHDVLEDTSVTMEDLCAAGFDKSIIEAVACMTHPDDESYADYVVRCKGNPIARAVKLADLNDNARLSRALMRPDRADSDMARMHRYLLSHKFLTDRIDEATYRALMEKFNQ